MPKCKHHKKYLGDKMFRNQFRVLFLLTMIFLVALVLRGAVAIYWHAHVGGTLYFGDSETYWTLAQCIAHGEPYRVGEQAIFRTPIYPLILSPLFWLEKNASPETLILAARLLNVFFGAATIFAVAKLATLITRDRWCGIVAAGIVAVDPLHIALSALVLTEIPFSLMMILSLSALVAAMHAESTRGNFAAPKAILAGFLSGVAVLIRPSWILFAAVMPLLFFLRGGENDARSVRVKFFQAVFFAAAFLLVLTPWILRNAIITGGVFVPTTLQVGASFYDGINPNATGASDMRFVAEFSVQKQSQEKEQNCVPENSVQQEIAAEITNDRYFRDAAIAWGKQHPSRVLKLAAIKFVRLWSPIPNEPTWRRFPLNLIIPLFTIPILILAAHGFFANINRGATWWILALPAIYFTLLHIIFVASIRYRAPAMLTLSILAAWSIMQMACIVPEWGRIFRKNRSRLE